MISNLAKKAESRKREGDATKIQSHVIFSERSKTKHSNNVRRKSCNNGFSLTRFCDENPKLRPSLCSGIIFSVFICCSLLVLYFFEDKYFIPCVTVAGASALALFVSIIFFCHRRRSFSQKLLKCQLTEDKPVIQGSLLNIEDRLLRKSITHFEYRCCEEMRESDYHQQKQNAKHKRNYPVCKAYNHNTLDKFHKSNFSRAAFHV